MHRVARAVVHPLCLVGGLALAVGGSVAPVLAHERRQAGQFQLTVGWAEEPRTPTC